MHREHKGGWVAAGPVDPGCTGIPSVEGSYIIYSCILIRGGGWAKDTPFTSFICTGLWQSGQSRPSYEDCVAE